VIRFCSSSSLFWFYNRTIGLELDARPGFLGTAIGNGGFRLHVAPNGDWQLHFYGTQQTLGYDAYDKQAQRFALKAKGNAAS